MAQFLQVKGVHNTGARGIPWSICFEDDLERIYTEELRARGHHPKPGTSASDLGVRFHQLFRARLEYLHGRKLRARYSNEMKDHPSFSATKEIALRARRGKPLWPYLSKHTSKAEFQDALLNHWGIVHFHLGENFQSDGYIGRTREHLYAWITDSTIHFIGIGNHTLADDKLLNIIVRNWPHLLKPFKLEDRDAPTSAEPPNLVRNDRMRKFTRTMLVHRAPKLSPGQTMGLRDAGVSPTFVAETGVHYSAPGGGLSTAGTGVYQRVHADHEAWHANWIAQFVAKNIGQLVGHIEAQRGAAVLPLEFHLENLEALKASSVLERSNSVQFELPLEFDRDLDPARIIAPIARAAAAVQ